MLREFPKKPWYWGENGISNSAGLTIEMLREYPGKDWNWNIISSNKALTIEMLREFSDKPWEWGLYGLLWNKNISIEMLAEYKDKPMYCEYSDCCACACDSSLNCRTLILTNKFTKDRIRLCGS